MDSKKPDSREELYRKHLAAPIEALRSDLLNLAVRIQYYRELFLEDSSRVDLLNRTASTFFFVLQQDLFAQIVVQLSRATDKPKTGGQSNLSLPFIAQKIGELQVADSSSLVTTLREKLSLIRTGVERSRKMRNKLIAHRDLGHALKIDTELGVPFKEVEETYAQIGSFMNEIELFFTNSTWGYPTEYFASRNGALSLIGALERSTHDMGEGEAL